MNQSKRQAALDYATVYGWPVFVCEPNSKQPKAGSRGFWDATTEPGVINGWFDENENYNIAFCPGSVGLCVVDLDSYKPEFLAPDLPASFTVQSPRGGEHVYYSGVTRSTQGKKLGVGVDVRSNGAYVLLPPSTTEHGTYEVKHDRPISVLPEWISSALRRDRRSSSAAIVCSNLDTTTAINRVTEYLRMVAPAVSGNSGNNTTFALAENIYDLGISVEKALELVQEWNKKCRPPWTDDELSTIFHNAWRYRADIPGVAAVSGGAAAVFQGLVSHVRDSEGRKDLHPLTIPEMRSRAKLEKPPEYLWKGRLLRNEPNLWTGDAGIGKTTLIENVAIAVASGAGLLGQPTIAAPVLLFVAEDRYSAVLKNLEQIASERSIRLDSLDIKVLSTDSEDCEHLLATITDDGEIYETPFFHDVLEPVLEACHSALLVFDPLAEFVDFDHNSDKAARACARGLLVPLSRNFGATPLVTDHPSKSSMDSGAHYGGSREMKAAFASFGTLRLTDPRERGDEIRQSLTFEILKTRYGPPSRTDFFRLGNSPTYKLDPAQGMTPAEIDKMVLTHILGRVEAGLIVGKKNTIYGPEQVASAVGTSTKSVERSIQRLSEGGLLIYLTDPNRHHPPTWAKGPKLQ